MNEPEQQAMQAFIAQQSRLMRNSFMRKGMLFSDKDWINLVEVPLELTYHEGNSAGHEVQILCHAAIMPN